MEQLTNNEYYNAYVYNNSGMFVGVYLYCVGEEDYPDELTFGQHKKLAISTANRLNKQKIKEIEKIKSTFYECPKCGEWAVDKEQMDTEGFDICQSCNEFVEKSEINESS